MRQQLIQCSEPYLGDICFLEFAQREFGRVESRLSFRQHLLGFCFLLGDYFLLVLDLLPLLLAQLFLLHRDVCALADGCKQLLAVLRLIGYLDLLYSQSLI